MWSREEGSRRCCAATRDGHPPSAMGAVSHLEEMIPPSSSAVLHTLHKEKERSFIVAVQKS